MRRSQSFARTNTGGVGKIVWISSDESVAKVTSCGKADKNGTQVQFPIQISCYKAGTVTITGKTSNGLTADCQVTVSEGVEDEKEIFTRFCIDAVDTPVEEGSHIETIGRLTVREGIKFTQDNMQEVIDQIDWTSSDRMIAEVTGCGKAEINGTQVQFPIRINCYKVGTVTITGRMPMPFKGKSSSFQISVVESRTEEKPTNVITKFIISEIKDGTKANSTIEIYGQLILDENSFIDEISLQNDVSNIEWTSSDKTIAEVTGCGKISIDERRVQFPIWISCYNAGTAQITGTIQSSKLSASCTVNVLDSHFEEESSEPGSEERPTEPDSEVSVYTVSFDTRNHGTAPKPYTNVQYGSKIKAPSEPQAYGYIFTGWYKDISCKNPWNFETDVVKSDITLYAGWVISDDTADDDGSDGVLPGDIPAGGIPDGLWIAGIKDYVYTGSPIKPQIRVYDSDKRLIAGQDYTIAYKNNTKVNNALDIKKAPTVVVKGKGNYAGTQTATFQILKADLSNDNIIAENMIIAFNNKVQKKVPTLMYHGKKLSNKKDFLVSYPNGGANAYMAPGTYDIVLNAAPQGSFTGKRTVKMTITSNAGTGNAAGSSINNAVISGITDKVYTGTVPEQNVVIVMDGKNLKEGVDYRINYPDTIQAGTVNLYITGINAYTGTVKKSFKILPYDISQDSGNQIGGLQKTVTAKYVKGGSKPKLKLTFGGKQMTEGTDYTVTYKNNKALGGNSSYTIKGKGNFKGTLTRNFTIVQKSLDDVQSPVCVIVPDMVYSNKAGKCISKPILTDTDGKKLVAGKDYIVGSYTLEDGTALTAQSIVGVNEKVQVEITGIGAYTGTVKAVYKITLQDFSKAKVSILNKAYTGKEITLGKDDISVRIGNAGLVYGTDYEIVKGSYVNNVKKGTAAVTIAGKGNYGGTKTVKFKITARKFLWGDWGKKTILSSGNCGDNVTYVLDSDGGLTISGKGDMDNYSYYKDNVYIGQPWHDLRELVNSVIIEDGITNIGSYAFYYCENLKAVNIPDTVREIGGYAFCGCNIEYMWKFRKV